MKFVANYQYRGGGDTEEGLEAEAVLNWPPQLEKMETKVGTRWFGGGFSSELADALLNTSLITFEDLDELPIKTEPRENYEDDGFWRPEEVHEQRVHRLLALQGLYELVTNLGWIEHTNDWDWRIHVKLKDGTVYPQQFSDEEADEKDEWGDSFWLETEAGDRIPLDQGAYQDLSAKYVVEAEGHPHGRWTLIPKTLYFCFDLELSDDNNPESPTTRTIKVLIDDLAEVGIGEA